MKQAEADQIVQAMKEKKIPVTYVLFPDEGHGFARPENNLAFYAVTEAFLAEQLGGRYEPIGKDFDGSSITMPRGGRPGARPGRGDQGARVAARARGVAQRRVRSRRARVSWSREGGQPVCCAN